MNQRTGLLYQVVDKYRIVERVGRGGVAEVFRAESVTGSGEVAIKVMLPEKVNDPAQVRSFESEFDILEHLDHPSIPQVKSATEVAGRPAMIMTYFPGPTLYAINAQGKKFDGVSAFYALVRIVAHLHQEKIIHGDIKLENVLVRPNGTLGLVDFGTARKFSGAKVITAMFRKKTKQVFGTPTYLAPELIDGGTPSMASDVYALGVCAHILIGGKPPFENERVSGRLRAAKGEQAPSLLDRNPKVPKAFAAIVDACIQKDRNLRPADAGALKGLLKERFGTRGSTSTGSPR